MAAVAPAYARLAPSLFSVECWGGATFDVAMRFLRECPWDRLAAFREAMPNLLLQMLLRSANAVGYTNYPDNVVRYFVEQAAKNGVDLFRVFDSLNWVENMRVAMDAVLETDRLCEAAICYTGNLNDPRRTKYDLRYYVAMAKELERAGAHILGIKDMAGLCQPRAAYTLVKALKEEIGIPIHFHTHDTSGIAAASVLMAVEAGVDAVDGALDAMSGLTSQPNLGSIVEALRFGPRDTGLDPDRLRLLSNYWEQVRHGYAAFESDMRSGASEVYVHGMPGGQYTNLREQARSLGIDDTRWHEVARAYAQVNEMFGDIVKVTPSSKVVGDMAIMMVTSGLTAEDVVDPGTEVAFPESVVALFRGDIGQPYGGFPAGAAEEDPEWRGTANGAAGFGAAAGGPCEGSSRPAGQKMPRPISDDEFASWLMYPKVFTDYMADRLHFGDTSVLPTRAFFYGLEPGEEITLDLAARQAPDHPLRRDQRRARRRHTHGVLRAERPAALGEDRRPQQGGEAPAAAQGGGGPPGPVGAPMPGTIVTVHAVVGHDGEARRRAGHHRGDEDGDECTRRPGRHHRRGRRAARRAGGREGPAGGAGGGGRQVLAITGHPATDPNTPSVHVRTVLRAPRLDDGTGRHGKHGRRDPIQAIADE